MEGGRPSSGRVGRVGLCLEIGRCSLIKLGEGDAAGEGADHVAYDEVDTCQTFQLALLRHQRCLRTVPKVAKHPRRVGFRE